VSFIFQIGTQRVMVFRKQELSGLTENEFTLIIALDLGIKSADMVTLASNKRN